MSDHPPFIIDNVMHQRHKGGAEVFTFVATDGRELRLTLHTLHDPLPVLVERLFGCRLMSVRVLDRLPAVEVHVVNPAATRHHSRMLVLVGAARGLWLNGKWLNRERQLWWWHTLGFHEQQPERTSHAE